MNGRWIPNFSKLELDRINDEKTVEIVSQEKNKFLHWLYLSCDYIFGCYMRCEGPVNSCMKVATLSKFEMKYIMTKKNKLSIIKMHG